MRGKFSGTLCVLGIASLVVFAALQCSPTRSDPYPAPVTGFTAVLGLTDCAIVQWHAPEIVAGARPASYDLRYSTSPMNSSTQWDAALPVTGVPSPRPPGTVQRVTIGGLEPSSVYYAAMRVVGENGRNSQFSIQIRLHTADTAGAHPFTAPDLEGTTHSSSEWLTDSVRLINFWGAWCGWCRKEMPDLIALYREFSGRGLTVVGYNYGDDPADARAYAEEMQLPWLNVVVPREVCSHYHISGFPTTLFLNRDGSEVGRLVGAQEYETFARAVSILLGDTL